MCLILFSLGHHSRFPLIIAANRDESYHRPAAPLAFWADAPQIAAGRDLEAGGTWLGITREGRWAALTNYRQAGSYRHGTPSRGRLVSDYLEGTSDPEDYIRQVETGAQQFNGFNLLVGHGPSAYYLSNREGSARRVDRGVHGLSNHLLDTPWPKVVLGKRALGDIPDTSSETIVDTLLHTLRNGLIPPDASLPDTGVGIAGERVLSPPFIVSESYGTRASTVVLLDSSGTVSVAERSFGPLGVPAGSTALTFALEGHRQRTMAQ